MIPQTPDDMNHACRFENRLDIRSELMLLFGEAPPMVRASLLQLLVSLKTSLSQIVKRPGHRNAAMPVTGWQDLLQTMCELRLDLDRLQSSRLSRLRHYHPDFVQLEHRFDLLRKAYEQNTLMIEIIYSLIAAGQEFQTAEEVLDRSADILLRELEADLFVCRLRDEEGNWINVATNSKDEKSTPLFVLSMEEEMPHHPVMEAVADPLVYHVLSNDLRGMELGGQSWNCMAFQEGYRSRLSFLLRDYTGKAFGLIMLYSLQVGFFDRYESQFMADTSKIISLTVGRQLELGRDALAKAAGGMAHVGNNVLGIMMNYNSLVIEELETLADKVRQALARTLPPGLEANPEHQALVREIESLRRLLGELELERKVKALHGVGDSIQRLKSAIQNLLGAVKNPVIMPYIRGEEVLNLEPLDNRG
jgi:hypothetical protein